MTGGCIGYGIHERRKRKSRRAWRRGRAYGAFGDGVREGLAMTGDDPIATGQAVKRTEALLRDARAVLSRVDVLLATALANEDPALPEIAALRDACDRPVAQLGWRAPQLAACRRWRTVAAIFRFAC
jgi:hypothetical protein